VVEVLNRQPQVQPGGAGPGAGADDPHPPSRRDFIHIATVAAAGGGAVAVAWPFINQMNPSADTLALASIEVEIGKTEVGQQTVLKWRGKPVFVRHRTPAEIAQARKDDHAEMKDPATDAARVKPGKDEWLILVGVCTHLGCVPNKGGEFGGWLCPCHGSVYDLSGRIRKGPAPYNLPVPEYAFTGPTKVKIG
jgi:ubiquinol-cytochrome c reductase iron-sulfur subunit